MKDKKVLNYIYISIAVYVMQLIWIYGFGIVDGNVIIFYIVNILWVIFFVKNIIDCVRLNKSKDEKEIKFNIYENSKIYLMHNKLYKQNIVFLIIYIIGWVIVENTKIVTSIDKFIEFIMGIMLFITFPYLMTYGLQFLLEIIFDYRKQWTSRKLQIKYMKKYFNEKKETLDLNIVLFKDDNGFITNYFSNEDLDQENDKNIIKETEYLIDCFINMGYFFTKPTKENESYFLENEEDIVKEGDGVIYLSIDHDLEILKKEFPDVDIEQMLRPYVIAYLETIAQKENYDFDILKFEEKCKREFNEIYIQHILVFEDLDSLKNKEKFEYMKYLKFYDKNDYYSDINNHSLDYINIINDAGAYCIDEGFWKLHSKRSCIRVCY